VPSRTNKEATLGTPPRGLRRPDRPFQMEVGYIRFFKLVIGNPFWSLLFGDWNFMNRGRSAGLVKRACLGSRRSAVSNRLAPTIFSSELGVKVLAPGRETHPNRVDGFGRRSVFLLVPSPEAVAPPNRLAPTISCERIPTTDECENCHWGSFRQHNSFIFQVYREIAPHPSITKIKRLAAFTLIWFYLPFPNTHQSKNNKNPIPFQKWGPN